MTNIERYLLDKNIKPNIKGFGYLTKAIEMAKTNIMERNLSTKIYPGVAKVFNTSSNRVERSIRNALSIAKVKMPNSEFIALSVLELSD